MKATQYVHGLFATKDEIALVTEVPFDNLTILQAFADDLAGNVTFVNDTIAALANKPDYSEIYLTAYIDTEFAKYYSKTEIDTFYSLKPGASLITSYDTSTQIDATFTN